MFSRKFPRQQTRATHRAFTLLELLMVVAVMILLLSLVAPVTNQVFMANQITVGAQTVVDQLNLARQTAQTKNRVVETRFYKFASAESVDTVQQPRAVQSFIYDETNTHCTALDEIHFLPDSTIISDVSTYSSLIQSTREKTDWNAGDSKLPLPRSIGSNYTAYTVRFGPDGSTNLGAGSWFATVRSVNGPSNQFSNYATIHIDPYNGSVRLYRPGL